MSRSIKITRYPHKTFIGKYVLESLSLGMYDHPLISIREYIQNSVDAIDDFTRENSDRMKYNGLIDITMDGRKKSIEIRDNGTGIPSKKAWRVLHDLGISRKEYIKHRGFRGIGRLGGLGYCDELRFTTKAKGENIVSTSVWDCGKLRSLVNEKGNLRDAASIIGEISSYGQANYPGDIQDHFFVVTMHNVKSSRDILLNVPAVKNWLSQVVPVPFSQTDFRFGRKINSALRQRVPKYETYNIRINGETIYKPYVDWVKIYKKSSEEIKGVRFFDLSYNSCLLAFGWLAELDLSGMIWSSTLVDGLRVRAGNILIGDQGILASLFREKRFSQYLVGEIHIVDNRLIPNSRRDDFEDNEFRDEFLTCFIKEIGIPYSRQIRELSAERSKLKRAEDYASLCARAAQIIERGYVAESQKRDIVIRLRNIIENDGNCCMLGDTGLLLRKLGSSQHILDKRSDFTEKYNPNLLKYVFEMIYQESDSKIEAEMLIEKIIKNQIQMADM